MVEYAVEVVELEEPGVEVGGEDSVMVAGAADLDGVGVGVDHISTWERPGITHIAMIQGISIHQIHILNRANFRNLKHELAS